MINPNIYEKLDEDTKAKYVLAVSMRAINRVYDTLSNYIYSMAVHENTDAELKKAMEAKAEDYVQGWNAACATIIELIADLKYDREDIDAFAPTYKEMLDEERRSDISLP